MNPLNLIPEPYRLLATLAAIALVATAVIGGTLHAKHSYDDGKRAEGAAPYIAALAAQKIAAAAVLAKVIAENAAASIRWAEYAKKENDDYESKIASVRANRNRATGLVFHDPGSRPGCSCTAAEGKENPGIPAVGGTNGQLSGAAADFLQSLAADADAAAIYAQSARAVALSCLRPGKAQ